ncbi:ABC transporter substrate-binding protein [Alkalicoccobacillus murimartini]|uniref:Spermidine/putrescine transport system substrate-binding protein n=1 Tax=Alkalicoccobacillus murimartini TaxID=171685 RepID=A0ABT9YGV9_9BACI|nr:ABC transporter substrate-binding protein [Alkalicoccobacillus murimartini]MDQ0206833.1 putative spermidine/putrescine transport system substrate-binding protein [Alkalicoccobacillus murimartini]
MKKLLGTTLVALSAAALTACGGSDDSQGSNGSPTKLVISTWGFSEDFFRAEVYAPFEEEHNVEIVLDVGNNAERLNKIRQGTANVDLVYLSDYYAQQAINDGLFAEIDRSNIPNIEEIYEVAQAPLGEEYGPAYTIGQFGIAYNADAVDQDITSWADLWDESLAKNLTIPGITSTTGPMFLDAASKVSGQDTFNEDAAFAQMAELVPNVVKEYDKTSDFVNMFSQGEVVGGPFMEMYFNDLKEAIPSAEFVTPEEGGYAVMNTVNIVEGSENKELAEEFINFQLSQDIQATTAKAKIDSPVNTTVELTDEEAEGITYGQDVVESLHQLDMEYVNEQSSTWIERWNQEIAQ